MCIPVDKVGMASVLVAARMETADDTLRPPPPTVDRIICESLALPVKIVVRRGNYNDQW